MENISQISVGEDLRPIEDTEARKKALEAKELANEALSKISSAGMSNAIPKEGNGVNVTAINNFVYGFQLSGIGVSIDVDSEGSKTINFG